METIEGMYTAIQRKFGDRFRRFCSPLKDILEINQFYHYRLTRSGQYAVIGLHTDWEEYYFSEKFHLSTPYFRHPDLLDNGIVLPQALDDESFHRVLVEGGRKFQVTLGLQIMHKTAEGVDAFGFGLKSADLFHHVALCREISLLRLFIDRFRQKFHSSLRGAFEEHQTDLASCIGPSFYRPMRSALKLSSRARFLKQMGIRLEVPITLKEREALKYLLQGYTAAQIAEATALSIRTIQHRLERLKEKFDCFSKSALVQKAQLLESLGYLG